MVARETGWTYDYIIDLPVWAFEQTILEMEWFSEAEKRALHGGSSKNLTFGK